MTRQNKLLFVTILLFAALTRFLFLDSYPPSLNWDEVSHGYTALSLAETGRDQWGVSWPIFNTRAYGDYPTMLNIYLTIPLVKAFGLTATSVRLPTALLGFFIVPLTFFLSYYFLKNYQLSLFAMFLATITPWFFFTSRFVLQPTIAQFFLLLGITLALYSLKPAKPLLFILSALFWAISSYGYHNTRIVSPLLFAAFIIIFRQQLFLPKIISRKILTMAIILFTIITIPQLLNLFSAEARARGSWVFIINDVAINSINTSRGQVANPLLGRLIFNKVTYFSTAFLTNYANFLNPRLLFFEGTANYQFNIPHTGILFSTLLPLFYLGLLFVIRYYRRPNHLFIISWFILGLLPAALTSGDFPILRAMTILPLPIIFIAFGFQSLHRIVKLKHLMLFFAVVLTYQFTKYLYLYLTDYSKNHASSWQYGYHQAVAYARTNYPNYRSIIFTKKYGEPHEFILFFWPWDPSSYQHDLAKIWDFHANWYWVDAFDKFRFVNDWEIKNLPASPSTLLITSPGNYNPNNASLLQTIYYPNQQPVFDIVAYDKN